MVNKAIAVPTRSATLFWGGGSAELADGPPDSIENDVKSFLTAQCEITVTKEAKTKPLPLVLNIFRAKIVIW
jgi:hypothetical protein